MAPAVASYRPAPAGIGTGSTVCTHEGDATASIAALPALYAHCADATSRIKLLPLVAMAGDAVTIAATPVLATAVAARAAAADPATDCSANTATSTARCEATFATIDDVRVGVGS